MQCYTAARKKLYPSWRWKNYTRWKDIWPKAAKQCLCRRIRPEVLVDTAFFLVRPFPHPNMLVAEAVLQAAADNVHVVSVHLSSIQRYRLELDDLTTLLRNGFDLRGALMHAGVAMSPLFRYTAALGRNLPDVLEHYLDAAIRQIQTAAPEYLTLYPDCIRNYLFEVRRAHAQ